MTVDQVDLGAYFARIGFEQAGAVSPTLETLRRIQFCHACTIPFENLDVLLGRDIRLDMQSVQSKLIASKRGGYCFEQNGLLLYVLRAIGFDVTPHSARVRIAVTRDTTPPRTHLFCRVMLDGTPWLADVGVGGLTPTGPIRMDTDARQETPHEPRRVVRERGPHGEAFFHQVLLRTESGEAWHDVCEFTGEAMPEIDREVANWWTSTNPESKFRKNIMAALARENGTRHTLATREYTMRQGGTVLERIAVESLEQLLAILAQRFGLIVDGRTGTETALNFGIDG